MQRTNLAAALLLALSAKAYAGKPEGGSKHIALGAEYRTEFIHDDHGIQKLATEKPPTTNSFRLTDTKIVLAGEFSESTNFRVRLNVNADSWQLGNPADLPEVAYGTMRLNNHLSLTIGKDLVLQGGWDNFDNEYDAIWGSTIYLAPFKYYAPTATFAFNQSYGTLSLQLTNDVTTNSGITTAITKDTHVNTSHADGISNTNNRQPAFILDYRGSYCAGMVRPLLQMGQYDLNHSRFIDLGVKIARGPLHVTFDYLLDNRASTSKGGGDKFLTYTLTALRVDYNINDIAKPFIYFAQVNRTGEKNVYGVDITTNSIKNADFSSGTLYGNDNASIMSLGASYLGFGANYVPYLVYHGGSGKYDLSGSEKSGAQTSIRLGVMGAI